MEKSVKLQAAEAIMGKQQFFSHSQLAAMADGCRGEEKEFFMNKFIEFGQRIDTMPKTYEQDGLGLESVAFLHYFLGGCDWYITEKDMDGGVLQAFGYAVLNGDREMAELGYISIAELVKHGAELDLHFTPKTINSIMGYKVPVAEECETV